MSRIYHKRKAEGVCVYCGELLPLQDYAYVSCKACRNKKARGDLVKRRYKKDVEEHPPKSTLIEKS